MLERTKFPLYLQLVLKTHPSIPQTNTLTACIFITSLLLTYSFKTISLISDLFKNPFLAPFPWSIFQLLSSSMSGFYYEASNNFQMPSKWFFYHCQLCFVKNLPRGLQKVEWIPLLLKQIGTMLLIVIFVNQSDFEFAMFSVFFDTPELSCLPSRLRQHFSSAVNRTESGPVS